MRWREKDAVVARVDDRVRRTAARGLERAAAVARDAAGWTGERGTALAPVTSLAGGAAASLDRAGEYVRTRDVRAVRGDLEAGVRERPVRTLGLAAAAGFVLGRLLR